LKKGIKNVKTVLDCKWGIQYKPYSPLNSGSNLEFVENSFPLKNMLTLPPAPGTALITVIIIHPPIKENHHVREIYIN
jgi:hypothetical protein